MSDQRSPHTSAGRQGQLDRQRERGGLGVARQREHARALLAVENAHLPPLDLRGLAVVAGVLCHEVLRDRVLHRLAQQRERLGDRPGRVAFARHLGHPAAHDRDAHVPKQGCSQVALDDPRLLAVTRDGRLLDHPSFLFVVDEPVEELRQGQLGGVGAPFALEVEDKLVTRLLGALAGLCLDGVIARHLLAREGVPVA